MAEDRETTGYERNDDGLVVKYPKEQEIDIRRPDFYRLRADTVVQQGWTVALPGSRHVFNEK